MLSLIPQELCIHDSLEDREGLVFGLDTQTDS